VVDGDVLVDFLNGVEGARTALERAADEGLIKVSAISAAEVIARAEGEGAAVAAKLLDSFEVLPVDREVASLAGVLFARGGRDKLELGDCLVAASCRKLEAVLLTKDRSKYPSDGFEVRLAEH